MSYTLIYVSLYNSHVFVSIYQDLYRLLGENVANYESILRKNNSPLFVLRYLARKHKNDIMKNPTFRSLFHEMCAKVRGGSASVE
ncbi:hypothetical protein Hanom_Chr00s177158g01830931 [Helianthus anomalus]